MTVLKSFLTIFLFSVILSLSIARADAISDYNKGVAAYKQGNHSKAAKWYRKAADQGYATAQLNLGYMYGKGLGVLKDAAEEVNWYRKAADQGHAKAHFNLGIMYGKGDGVLKDATEAAWWYRKAADQGDATAQLSLGYMYGKGLGVLKDNILAHMWFNIAATKGHKMGKRYRGIVEKRMTAAEIFKAMKKAKRCFKSSYKDCG